MDRDRSWLVILFQFTLLAIDVVLNVLSDLRRSSPVALLLIFIIQDFCIVMSLLVMCLTIFNTYAFQVGEFREVAVKFRVPVTVNLTYLALSLALHVWSMEMDEDGSPKRAQHSWQTRVTDVTLFTLQRFAGVWHYYFYKKTAVLMADDQLYHPKSQLPTTKCPVPMVEQEM